MFNLRHERPEDGPHIDALLDLSFGPGRFAKTAYRLREGVEPITALSWVAEEDGDLRATIRFWPVMVGGKPCLMLGPIAVHPDHRGRGIAVALMNRSLDEAAALGHRAVILVGDEPYYARVGFAQIARGTMTMPGPVDYARLLGRDLATGGLSELSGKITPAF